MIKLFLVFAVLCIAFVASEVLGAKVVSEAKLVASPYHRWAHLHWVWNFNSYSNQVNVTELIDDYEKHDIKFGAVNIDSTWATSFNNFQPNPEKFNNFPELVSYIHKKGKKVIMWATSFVNDDMPEYEMAVEKKYLVRDKHDVVRPIKWWKGKGGLLDYTNPEAREWWHSMMDNVLSLPTLNGDGIDGFKCDASDPYIIEYMLPPGGKALGFNNVPYESHAQYADYYYGDFFNYTRSHRGTSGLVMGRPVDCAEDKTSQVCLDHSPKYTMTSGWVGDDDNTMNGLRSCAHNVIYSAWEGYANFGCDVGGYRNKGDENKADRKEMFIRSAQFNAFLPLMENGGGGEHRPWMIDPTDHEIVPVYRNLVNEHTRLSPYMHTVGTKALLGDFSSITPLAVNSEDRKRKRSHRRFSQPSTYSYLLGDDILVHPPLYAVDEKKTGHDISVVEMTFTGDDKTLWLDWFHPTNEEKSYIGGTKHTRAVPLIEYPVYVRQGALLALLEDGGKLGVTDEHISFTWFAPRAGMNSVTSEALEPIEVGPGIQAIAQFSSESTIEVKLSAHEGPIGLTLVDVPKASKVDIRGLPCLNEYNPLKKTLDVKCPNNKLGTILTIEFN